MIHPSERPNDYPNTTPNGVKRFEAVPRQHDREAASIHVMDYVPVQSAFFPMGTDSGHSTQLLRPVKPRAPTIIVPARSRRKIHELWVDIFWVVGFLLFYHHLSYVIYM